MKADGGQATVEVVGALPALLLAGVCFFQMLAVAAAAVLAGSAAQAGALAVATGADPAQAVRMALPEWQRSNLRVAVDGGRVQVTLQPPGLLAALSREPDVSSVAVVRPP